MSDDEDHSAPFDYVVAKAGDEFHVFIVHDATPQWWRLVATFRDADRAEQYAEVEKMMADDTSMEERQGKEPFTEHRADEGTPPAELPSLPRSGLGELVRRTHVVEHTRIEQSEVREPPQVFIPREVIETATAKAIEALDHAGRLPNCASELIEAPDKSLDAPNKESAVSLSDDGFPPNEMADDPVDASTLPILTPNQAKAFVGIGKTVGTHATLREIGEASGLKLSQVTSNLDNLQSKGYIANIGVPGAPCWRILAKGQPRVDEQGEGPPPWSAHEDAFIQLNGKTGEMSIAEIALKVKRTEAAVTARFALYGLYHDYMRARAAFEAKGRSAAYAPPKAAAPAAPKATPAARPTPAGANGAGDEEAVLDDLSAPQKAVLKAVVTLKEVKGLTDSQVALAAGVDEGRLSYLYGRLEELGCMAKGRPTDVGLKLVAQMSGA